jgi:tetratricopeptide (TPR) repeat protein
MARGKEITADKLEALGARRLAELLAELSAADPVVRKAVKLALAAGQSPAKLLAEIDKRIRTIARSKTFIDWDKRKPLVQELENLRTTITGSLAPLDVRAAAERMVNFLNLSDTLYERVDDSSGTVATVFGRAVADVGHLWAQVPGADAEALAHLALSLLRSNAYGVKDGIVSSLATAMGAEGRARLKAMLQKALAAAPKPRSREWSFDGRRHALAQALAELADVEENVDAYIDAVRSTGSEAGYAVEIAKRLLKAGRAQEALDWLDKARVRHNRDLDDVLYHGGWIKDEVTDLRIAALDASGRKDEAQQVRWTSFTETLDAGHLRDHLKRLPDFEDFEAEERAKELARRFADPHRALVFFVAWRDLHAAAQLVRERLEEFDGRDYVTLGAAAEALAGKHPVAATLLYRRMIESILGRASANQYGYAVRDVRNCESLAGQISEDSGIEGHDAFMARLRKEHGRKSKFWELVREGA